MKGEGECETRTLKDGREEKITSKTKPPGR